MQRHRDRRFQEAASTWLCEEHGITGEEKMREVGRRMGCFKSGQLNMFI